MKVLVLTKLKRKGLGSADEYDFINVKKTLENIKEKNLNIDVKFDIFKNYKNYLIWCPEIVVFLGFDDQYLKIQKIFSTSKTVIWAKCDDLFLNKKFVFFFKKINFIFDSNFYKKNLPKKFEKKYLYLPTAIHLNYKSTIREKLLNLHFRKILLGQIKKVDIVFSGSPRFNRKDKYRQKLISILLENKIKVLICAPRSLWMKSGFFVDDKFKKYLYFSANNSWATPEVYYKAKYVLDLPWLDTIIEDLDNNYDPQFALGWNILKAGFYGANIMTYKCKMNQALGLNDNNVNFYKKNILNISDLAHEIISIVNSYSSIRAKKKKKLVKTLFRKKHIYSERWNKILYTILNLEKKICKKNKY